MPTAVTDWEGQFTPQRNGSGLEPVHRFQESDDAMGLAMAIPLAHFEVSGRKSLHKPARKLLCFTDHRQRAAAFPSLLEEKTFSHDMGRAVVKIVNTETRPLDLIDLGDRLADIANSESDNYNPDFFLPVSRLPDEEPDAKTKNNLWLAETFSYFGVPDSARESAEDLGLVAVQYHLSDSEKAQFSRLPTISNLRSSEADSLIQVLLGYMRQRKAFTLPKGRVQYDAPAFGRVYAEISFVKQRKGIKNINGWLSHGNKDTVITDYLRRVFKISREQTIELAEMIWNFLTSNSLLIDKITKRPGNSTTRGSLLRKQRSVTFASDVA